MIKKITDRILQGGNITPDEAKQLLDIDDKTLIYSAANKVKKHFVGDNVEFCSIINAKSGSCSEDCKWCSQSAHYNTFIEKYSFINGPRAVQEAVQNTHKGVNRFSLVTSGHSLKPKELEKAVEIYTKIQAETPINLCASMGLLSKMQLLELKEAGVVRYHCNLETAPSYFGELCSTHTINEKLQTIKHAQEVGMEICSGGIIGMGESMEQRMELAFLLRKANVDSIPLNILNPIKGTPLENVALISNEEVLLTIAMFKMINPQSRIRVAGGRERFSNEFQAMMLNAGVCSLLVGDYLTTIGNRINDDKELVKSQNLSIYKNYEQKHELSLNEL